MHVTDLLHVLMLVLRPASPTRAPGRLREIASDLPLCHAALRAAFETEQFDIAYQPVVRAQDLEPVACEALLRWQHPSRGAQLPSEFVPILERSPLILDVGDWLVEQSARQLIEWDRMGIAPVRMAVNVATTQLFAADFPARIARVLERTGVAPQRLVLEFSQDALHGRQPLEPVLARLATLGVGLELDDFGGGPSVIGRLAALGFCGVKLDRRFIAGLSDLGAGAQEDVRLLADLARERGLRCIAEGVQTEAELDALRALGVSEMQGFLFCKAVAPPAFERFMHAQRSDAARTLPMVGATGRA